MNTRKGILLMVAAMLCFSLSDAFIKASSGVMTQGQIIFWLGIGGTVILGAALRAKNQTILSPLFFDKYVILRNFGEVVGVCGIFTAIMIGTLSKTLAIHQLQPVLVTLGAAVFLREHVGVRRWFAILFALACVILIIRPSATSIDASSLFALVGAVGLSIRDIATKKVPPQVTTLQLSLYAYVALIPLGLVIALIFGETFRIAPSHWYLMAGILTFSMLAYLAITQSVRLADISVVAPFRYTRLIFIFVIGILIFGETPDWQTYAGAAGIILSGLFVIARERQA